MSNNPRVTRAKFVPSFGLVVQHADGLIIFVNADGEETPLRAADSKTADHDGLIAKALFGEEKPEPIDDPEGVALLRMAAWLHEDASKEDYCPNFIHERWDAWATKVRAYLAALAS